MDKFTHTAWTFAPAITPLWAMGGARHFTRRQAVIAFEEAFHGRTQLALSLRGKSKPYKSGFGPFAPEIYRVPFAYCYRCPYDITHPSEVKCARRLGGTFGGNPVGCRAALEVLKAVDTLHLSEHSERIGRLFESTTREWLERFPLIGDIRGVGAMRAIELVRDRFTKEPAETETKIVLAGCHRRGLLMISAGTFGNVIRLLVPLAATDDQIAEGLGVLQQALVELHRQ